MSVSARIGLGLAALGRPGYITLGRDRDLGEDRSVEAMRVRCHEVLDRAYQLGVRYFDAARSYGRSEEFLGDWLGEREAVVASKWGYTYTAGWSVDAETHETKDHSLATFRRQLGETRAILGDRLAVYQIHSATLDSGALDRPELLDALARLRDEGVTIGITTTGPRQRETVERALTIEQGGAPLFRSVQATYNVLERSVEPALLAARQAGWRVVVKEALANGRLAVRGDHGEVGDVRALSWVLARPFVDVVLSGAVTVAQLESNLSATATLSPDEEAKLSSLLEPPEDYWRARARLRWS